MKKILFVLITSSILISSALANDLPENVYDANSLQIHMRQNFYYGIDRVIPNYFEYFQTPQILEFTRIGDCDDFAIYSWHYLKIMGYNVEKYVLFLKDEEEIVGHAVTVFYDFNDNTYTLFSNQYLFKTLKTSPLEAIKDIHPTWQIIFKWSSTKVGYLTNEEVFNDCEPLDFINLETIKEYYNEYKTKVLDYVNN